MKRSAFVFLLHAHDRVWRNGTELRARIAACDLIWRAAIAFPPKAEVTT